MTDILSDNSIRYQGLAAAPGCAHGPAYRWHTPAQAARTVHPDPVSALHDAFAAARARLDAALTTADATLAPLLDAQRLMLDDPDFHEGTVALAEAGTDPAEAAVTVAGQLAAILESADSDYFRERAIDVRAIGALVAEAVTGPVTRRVPPGAVVLADELAPLDTAQLIDAGVAAFVTVRGGPTCHAAIVARAWGIPAVVGLPEGILDIAEQTPLRVDGDAGTLITHPTAQLCEYVHVATTVRLSRRVPVYANAGSLKEAARAAELGAEGLGLLRTEFLFQDRTTPPSEDEQTEEYLAILRQFAGRPVIIRTLDIGADKPAPFLPMPVEANPQLGLRGIRLCLQHRDLFLTQLRALVRASAAGTLKIMLPMVTTVDEVCATRALLETAARDLGLTAPPLGAMIEVPMAALAAPELAAVCDFFSLGTNDLMQFLLAADRQHAGVGYLHTADHPAVWRLLAQVVDAAHAAHIPVGVCGEWGSDPAKLAHLLEIGIDTVSVAAGALPRVLALFADAVTE